MRTRAPYELYRVPGSPFWYCYFLTREGERFRRSTRETLKDRAHAVAREWERKLGDPTHCAADAATLAGVAPRLREHLDRAGRAPDTIAFYEKKVRQVLRVLGADRPMSQVTAPAIDALIATRSEEGAAPHTVAKELTALRMLLKVARRRGEFDREVSQVMPVGFDPKYVPVRRRVTVDEAWGLVRALPGGCSRYVAFVCATTARDSAAHRAVGADLRADGIDVHDFKTRGSRRVVPLTEVTRPFAAAAFAGVAPDAPVAPGLGGLRAAMQRACARIGLTPLSPNDLRRSVAHWLLEAGVPRDVAAAFLGHASTRMLDAVYGRLDHSEVGAAIARALRPQ